MPTTDKSKNRLYVKKHKDKKKQEIGVENFNKFHALEQQQYRTLLRNDNEEEYKKKQNEYMKQYRAKKKASKASKETVVNEKVNVLQNAIRNRLARKKLLEAKQTNANEMTASINKEREAQMKNKFLASVVSNDMLNSLFPQVINELPIRNRRVIPKK